MHRIQTTLRADGGKQVDHVFPRAFSPYSPALFRYLSLHITTAPINNRATFYIRKRIHTSPNFVAFQIETWRDVVTRAALNLVRNLFCLCLPFSPFSPFFRSIQQRGELNLHKWTGTSHVERGFLELSVLRLIHLLAILIYSWLYQRFILFDIQGGPNIIIRERL